jgi:hypothetical protein
LVEFLQGFVELRFSKVRPKGIGDNDFGIGELPEHKIRESELATGTYHEFGIGYVG